MFRLRHQAGVGVLVRRLVETQCEGFQIAAVSVPDQGDQRAGIDPSRERDADRDIGDKLARDGGFEFFSDALEPVRFRERLVRAPVDVGVGAGGDPGLADLGEMPGRQPGDAPEHRLVAGNVAHVHAEMEGDRVQLGTEEA